MAEKFGEQVKIYYTNNKQTTSVTGIDASSYILFNGGSNHIYTHGKDFAADPSHTHKFLELSDVKDTFSKPADTTNTWVPVDVNGKIYHREIPAAYNQDPSTLSVNSANTANIANTANSLSATCAANDYIGIKGGESNDNGYLEIYTGDNGNEPIYLKQYSYDSSVAIHTATLLDSNGNTSFPGTISSNGHTVLTNRIDPIISVACTSSGILTFTSNNNNKYEFNFNHTHDLSQLTGKIKVECLPDAALKDTTYSYSVTQSATNNNANPYLTLTPSNSGTVSNIQLAGGSNVTITRDSASKIIISMSGMLNTTSIELFDTTPYIDFHYQNSTDDYTSRIAEYSSGVLTITGGLEIYNNLSAQGGNFYTDSNGAYWTSDIRKKHDFSDITKDIVDKFFEKNYFKHFKWNDTNHDSWGVAAQEFEEWAPEAINTDEDGFKSANYDVAEAKAIAAMTYKIKEQQSVISELKEKLEKLENTLNKLI